jgi:hypothetical protein
MHTAYWEAVGGVWKSISEYCFFGGGFSIILLFDFLLLFFV